MNATYLALVLIGWGAHTAVATAQSPVSMRQPPVAAAQTGWFGVTLSNNGTFNQRGEVFFEGYPIVSEVEVGSPAARAGVRPGDILMTFNTYDMRESAFQIRRLLRPGAPFELRIRRDGAVRMVRGILASQPDGWRDTVVVGIGPLDNAGRGQAGERPRVSTERVVIRTPRPTRVPAALIPAFTFGSGVYPFAGMEFMALNEDLREMLGVKPEGVFVSSVAEDTPARVSGLRGGDVLIQADSVKLNTPNDFVNAIAEAEGRALRLRIIRNRKPQTLTLSW